MTEAIEIQSERKFHKVYIALEELDFMWDEPRLNDVRALWNGGMAIGDIAKECNRSVMEVYILLLDQAQQAKIEQSGNMKPMLRSLDKKKVAEATGSKPKKKKKKAAAKRPLKL